MKIKTLMIVFSVLFSFFSVFGQINTDGVRFLNIGAMHVGANAVVFIDGDMQTADPVGNTPGNIASVISLGEQASAIHLTGSFIHDATGNVFEIMNADWLNTDIMRGVNMRGFSSFHFVGNSTDNNYRRYITSTNLDFDRVANYIAFATLAIDTNDTIFVSPTMGLDAGAILSSFYVTGDLGEYGVLRLLSGVVSRAGGDYIYTASLRLT